MKNESELQPKYDDERGSDDGASFFNAEVGAAIRRFRRLRHYTQARLAELAEISPNYVARLERGELAPSFGVAVRLSRALAIAPTDLVVEFRVRCARNRGAA